MGKIVAAIPTCRPGLCREAVKAWKKTEQFDGIWVMWDGDDDLKYEAEFSAELPIRLFIPNRLSMIPQHSSCCRSRLVYEAWLDKDVEWLVHLDDDVKSSKPSEGNWRDCINVLVSLAVWFNPMQDHVEFSRGYPYELRKRKHSPKIVHGVWIGVPDFDAISQLKRLEDSYYCTYSQDVIPRGQYFPMSSMAVAIHRDLFPASYFMWMGWDLPLNKYGDIWCGVILKKICDYFDWPVTSGAPVIYHERASNTWKNLRAEATTIEYNEHWWKWVDAVDLRGCDSVLSCYRKIAEKMYMPNELKFKELREKMIEWANLFVL